MQDTNIHIRASAEFKEQARQQAADSGFTTVSQYIKYLVANDKKESNGKRKQTMACHSDYTQSDHGSIWKQ